MFKPRKSVKLDTTSSSASASRAEILITAHRALKRLFLPAPGSKFPSPAASSTNPNPRTADGSRTMNWHALRALPNILFVPLSSSSRSVMLLGPKGRWVEHALPADQEVVCTAVATELLRTPGHSAASASSMIRSVRSGWRRCGTVQNFREVSLTEMWPWRVRTAWWLPTAF